MEFIDLSKNSFDEKKTNKIVALVVFLIALIGYFITVAPTTSYWDCGEFIATSYTMSVPHPPGAPLFLLLGRVFSMIPFVGDIALRVNTISVLASAFTVLFLYLISVRLIKAWRGEAKDKSDAFIIFGASAIGALTYAFTETFWFNAVEAEVYALSMFFSSIIIWLGLVWIEKHKDPDSSRYLVLLMLLVGLGTGVHLLNVLTLPAVLFLMWFFDKRTTIIAGMGIVLSIMVLFAFPLDWKIASLFIFVILTALFHHFSENNKDVSLAFIMPLLMIIGYSTYIMVYIRANLNPPINENDPSTWEKMLSYLNREQYGDSHQLTDAIKFFFTGDIGNRKYAESVQKMGAAVGSDGDHWKNGWVFFWKYQIVEMYWRYFNWQFIGKNMDNIKQIVSFKGLFGIPFFVGLWGMLHHFFKDRRKAIAFAGLFLLMGVGLIVYQNQDWGQPRERDYFYVGSFFVFSIWISMGISSILESLKDNFKKKNLIMPVFMLALIVPGVEISSNHFMANRSGNFVAWDYSHNILETCEKNAILFTNGDNDTFPLWYLQEVEGLRKDITVINLSLLNTEWYIRQLKNKLPELVKRKYPQFKDISFDREIDLSYNPNFFNKYESLSREEQTILLQSYKGRFWDETKTLKIPNEKNDGKIIWDMKPTTKQFDFLAENKDDRKNRKAIKIQDQMVLELIAYNAYNNWKRPIYFAVTVSSSNYIGLSNYMRMDGLCFRLTSDKNAGKKIEPQMLYSRMLGKYKDNYRNLGDKSVYYDDNKIRLLQNYRSGFLQLASYYLNNSASLDTSKAELDYDKFYKFDEFNKFSKKEKISYLLEKMEGIIPSDNIPYTSESIIVELASIYRRIGEVKKGEKILDTYDSEDMSLKNKVRFLYYVTYRKLYDYGFKFADKVITDIETNSNGDLENYMEIYASLMQTGKNKVTDKFYTAIKSKIAKIGNKKLRAKAIKELSVAFYQSGNVDMAVNELDKYLKTAQKDMEAYELKFQMLQSKKKHKEALKVVDDILKVDSTYGNYKKIRTKLLGVIKGNK